MLKPPGAAARRPAPVKVAGREKVAAKTNAEDSLSPNTRAAIKAAKEADAAEIMAPTLRRSTLQRVEEAEKERQQAEKSVSLQKLCKSGATHQVYRGNDTLTCPGSHAQRQATACCSAANGTVDTLSKRFDMFSPLCLL